MNIVDWFDCDNEEHLRAYVTLQNKGVWPHGFITSVIEFSDHWQVALMAKLANAYVDLMLSKDGGK